MAATLSDFEKQIPPTVEIRRRLEEIFLERRFLHELLKLATKRDAAHTGRSEPQTAPGKEVIPCR